MSECESSSVFEYVDEATTTVLLKYEKQRCAITNRDNMLLIRIYNTRDNAAVQPITLLHSVCFETKNNTNNEYTSNLRSLAI